MLIENPDAFKTWLTSILEPLCDADPAALAKYVYALVKKDKPLDDLRDGMLDQLDVFLQQETKPFVDMLFRSLESQEYLATLGETEPDKPEDEQQQRRVSQSSEDAERLADGKKEHHVHDCRILDEVKQFEEQIIEKHEDTRRVVFAGNRRPPYNEQTLVKHVPDLLDEPLPEKPRSRREGLKDKERRRRRSRSSERWSRRSRRAWRNASPPPPPSGNDQRPSHVRRRNDRHDRHDREPPIHHRERERSRTRSRSPRSVRSRSTPPRDDKPCMNAAPMPGKRRCRDFDEKGYCMRGDLCQWDHGSDPVVLEDAALSRVLTVQPIVPEYNPLAPDIWSGGPMFPPHYPPHPVVLQPTRELVPLPRARLDGPQSQRPQVQPKKNFDYNRMNRQGGNMGQQSGACSLLVKKIPRGLNDIVRLSGHFDKFGTVTKIEVNFENDQECALITYATHAEANVAYKSTEAVLNNRFIKVFWYNPEQSSKQENVPPMSNGTSNAKQNLIINNNNNNLLATGGRSHNKVLINKTENQETKEKQDAASKGNADVQKMADMRRRAQALLETQIKQQLLLIQKLETGNVSGTQKAALLEAIKSAQEGIEKLRKELLSHPKTAQQQTNQAVKKPKSREEAVKEILDAELDLYTKQQEGEDVTELAKKVAELRRQHNALTPAFNKFSRRPAPGATSWTNRSTSAVGHRVVDRRARALLVRGVEEADRAQTVRLLSRDAVTHSMQPGGSLLLLYKTRAAAERAHTRATLLNKSLQVEWVTAGPKSPKKEKTDKQPPVTENPAEDDKKEEQVDAGDEPDGSTMMVTDKCTEPSVAHEEEALLHDEDDDDQEERSWKR